MEQSNPLLSQCAGAERQCQLLEVSAHRVANLRRYLLPLLFKAQPSMTDHRPLWQDAQVIQDIAHTQQLSVPCIGESALHVCYSQSAIKRAACRPQRTCKRLQVVKSDGIDALLCPGHQAKEALK